MLIESVVLKYEFPEHGFYLDVDLKVGDKVVHADFQRGRPCIWVLTHTGGGEKEKRTFTIWGTGDRFDRGTYEHISSCLVDDGRLVFHFFEKIATPPRDDEARGYRPTQ